MARPPTTTRGRDTKAHILSIAAQLVRQHGVAATTLDAVEQMANVGRSQIYHYFDGRDDLLRQVAARAAQPLIDRAGQALRHVDDSLRPVEDWFDMLIKANQSSGGAGGCPLGSLVGQLAEHDDATRTVLAQSFDEWERPLAVALHTLRENAVLRDDVDTGVLADQIMAALQGGLLLAQVRRDPGQLQRALHSARQLLHRAATASHPDPRTP